MKAQSADTHHTFIILAAGIASRYDGPGCKQLLPIDGESLLKRMVRQFSPHGRVIIAAHNPDFSVDGAELFNPQATRYTCETALSTQSFWTQRTTILLGDMFYTPQAVELIIKDRRDLSYFTDGHDIFALGFNANKAQLLKDTFARVIDGVLPNDMWRGRLWASFHLIYNYAKRPKVKPWTRGMIYIADETQDFDSMEDYHDFLAGKSKNMLHPSHRRTLKPHKQVMQALAILKSRLGLSSLGLGLCELAAYASSVKAALAVL